MTIPKKNGGNPIGGNHSESSSGWIGWSSSSAWQVPVLVVSGGIYRNSGWFQEWNISYLWIYRNTLNLHCDSSCVFQLLVFISRILILFSCLKSFPSPCILFQCCMSKLGFLNHYSIAKNSSRLTLIEFPVASFSSLQHSSLALSRVHCRILLWRAK